MTDSPKGPFLSIAILPEHEELAQRARVLFRKDENGAAKFPTVKVCYGFFTPGELINHHWEGDELVKAPFTEQFIPVPEEDINRVCEAIGVDAVVGLILVLGVYIV